MANGPGGLPESLITHNISLCYRLTTALEISGRRSSTARPVMRGACTVGQLACAGNGAKPWRSNKAASLTAAQLHKNNAKEPGQETRASLSDDLRSKNARNSP